jgi:hypothetical protein
MFWWSFGIFFFSKFRGVCADDARRMCNNDDV